MKRLLNLTMMTISALFIIACSPTPTTYRSAQTTTSSSKVTNQSKSLVRFEQSGFLSEAMDKAKAEGKYIFIDFYSQRCPPCKLMDEVVYTDKELAAFLNKHFINVKIDGALTSGANLASLFDVRAFPTLIFTDMSGNVLTRREGGTSISTLRYMAEEALKSTASR